MASLKQGRDSRVGAREGQPSGSLASLDEEWLSLQKTALVMQFRPGTKTWLELAAALGLAATSPHSIAVAVAPGSNWGGEFEHFAIELVRVVTNPRSADPIVPDCARTRVFRYGEVVDANTLRQVTPRVPDQPWIEELRRDGVAQIDLRGLQHIELGRWNEEIALLLKGAWLITRDSGLLTAKEAGYEVQISGTIEKMARSNHSRPTPPRFTKTAFIESWPIRMSRSHLYNIIAGERWHEIEQRYYNRWEELHREITPPR